MSVPFDSISVTLDPLPPLADLAASWCELEARAQPSFFLSWSWIGTWLDCLGDHVRHGRLLCARQHGRLVGLAVVFDAPIRRRVLPLGRAAYVNETGIPAFDELTIEHNGLLLDTSQPAAVQQAMFDRLCWANSPWREVQMRHADGVVTANLDANSTDVRWRADTSECSLVRLQRVRERGGDFLGLLSAGRRAHLRRCMRAYATVGRLHLEQAQDVPTALAFLDRLQVLHDRRWAERGRPTAFGGAFCREFHRRLVTDALPRGELQMLRVSAGAQELGYLYSFVHNGRVCFYQSGYDYDLLGPKHSPGLVTLALAIQHNAALGHDVFDFMAGSQTYKAALATDTVTMISWTAYRRSMLSVAEEAIRWTLQLARRFWTGLRLASWGKGTKVPAVIVCWLVLTPCHSEACVSQERALGRLVVGSATA